MLIKDLLIKKAEEKASVGTTPYLEIGDIDTTTKKYYKKEKGAVSGAKYAYRNSILVSTVRPTRGAITIVEDEKIAVSSAFAILNVDEKKCNYKYLFYYLNKEYFLKYLEKCSKGATYPTCSKEAIYSYKIELPDIDTQNKIVRILDNISNLISNKNKQLDKCNIIIKSQFVELFGEPIKNTLSFPTINIGDRCFVTKLAGFEYSKYIKYKNKGDVIMIRGLNVKDQKLKLDDVYYIDQDVSDSLPRSQLKNGDICMTYVGINIGDVALVDNKNNYHLAPNVAKISINDLNEINPQFFVYLLAYNKNNFASVATNTAKQVLNMDRIRKLNVMLPPIDLQNKFAIFVERVDRQKFEFEKQIKKLEELQASLMQEYFG